MNLIGMIVGALAATFILSRLALWITRSWQGGNTRLVVVHAACLTFATVAGGFGFADGGEFAGARAFSIYVIPQVVWLVVDIVALRGRTRS